MSVKQWFKNLRSYRPPSSLVGFYQERIDNGDEDMLDYYEKQLTSSYPEEIKSLKKVITRILKERKTATQNDFDSQLQKVLDANTAQAHQKLLGVSKDSEISVIIYNNFCMESAKLRFLVYDDLGYSDEEAESIIECYVKNLKEGV